MKFINQKILAICVGLVVLFAGVGTAYAASTKKKVRGPNVIPGEYVVQMTPVFSGMTVSAMSDELDSKVTDFLDSKGSIAVVSRPIGERPAYAMEQIRKHPGVQVVEPNYIYSIDPIQNHRSNELHAKDPLRNKERQAIQPPNDEFFSQLWGLDNTGQPDPTRQPGVAGVDIDALKAWSITKGSKDVIVAVIDTGVDHSLADLQSNMWTNLAEQNGKEGVDDDGNGLIDDIYGYDFANDDGDPVDDHGHGSHVAGTIGATGNDGVGIVGVAWNVKIMALKFMTAQGQGTLASAVKSIDYATNMGAHISNNSWGGGNYSTLLEAAIQRAHDKGALFVAAAGNNPQNNDVESTYPANYNVPNVLSVAAIDNQGKKASFSAYGPTKVHVAAPGVNVMSTTPNGYKSFSGTSMAAPHVAGVAALLLSNDRLMGPIEVKNRIVKTSRPISSLRGKILSGGIVNAYFALTDQVAPIDPNDPFHWKESQAFGIETDHPYTINFKKSWRVTVPGAKKLAIHFEKFDTEVRWDPVVFKDTGGNTYGSLSGKADDSFSPVVPGDTIVLEFTSDHSKAMYGFKTDRVVMVK